MRQHPAAVINVHLYTTTYINEHRNGKDERKAKLLLEEEENRKEWYTIQRGRCAYKSRGYTIN